MPSENTPAETPNSDQASPEKTEEEKREEEIATLRAFITEKNERIGAKQELRKRNQAAESSRGDESLFKKLDSSIKRITSFIKRLKSLTESQKDSLAKDLVQLNLSKYISEVAAAFTEAKLKMNDITCAIHLCSLMHQYYGEFAPTMFELWQKVLNIKKDEKVANPSKLRVDLRFFAELITIGILPEKESLSLLGNQLTILTLFDKDHSNISIVSSFCKNCGEDFADLVSLKMTQLAEKHNIEIPRNTMYSADRQKAVRNLLKEYYKSLCQHLINDHKEIQKLERQNRKIYQTKGELSADKKEKCDQALLAYQKLLQNTEILADLLGEAMPELPADEISKKDEDFINIDIYTPGRADDFDSNTSPWEDEDTRMFYECYPDLKALIPQILYKDSEKVVSAAQQETSTPVAATSDDNKDEQEKLKNEEESILKEVEEPEEEIDAVAVAKLQIQETDEIGEEESGGTTMKAMMDVFIAQLPNCVNRELIDKAAKDFCMMLNTKLNRKRLVNALFQVQRTRLDLLPFYSRLVATLNPCMPELANDLGLLLKNDFRFHVKKKDQINIESKIKNVRFIGELVKFKMFPKTDALNCLKTLLTDLKHHNIEMACNLLETCGRYLYRIQESHQRMKLFLEILMRKKQAVAMDKKYTIMIENAFYYCNPPENKQVEKKVRIPIHEYLKKLLYKDLNKITVEKVLRQMRKINWKDEDIHEYAVKCLIAGYNVRYNSIHCLASLVAGLASYYEEVGIMVVDGVIEDIRLGLEVNIPKYNQRRISMIKYLGELYNYRMIDSSIIFKTLYTVLTYAVTLDVNAISDLDPIDNYFRIRLLCTLLETCGQYFERGNSKKKLDCFLLYYQRYLLFKKENVSLGETGIFPIDVEYVYTDTISSLRPNFKFATSYAQACEMVNEMEKEVRESLAKAMSSNAGECTLEAIKEDEEESPHDDEDYDSESKRGDDENNRYSFSHDDAGANQSSDETNELSDDKEDDNIVVQTRPKPVMSKEDEEFMRAFESTVSENISQRAKESFKMTNVDIALPMHLNKKKIQEEMEEAERARQQQQHYHVHHHDHNHHHQGHAQMTSTTTDTESMPPSADSTQQSSKQPIFNFIFMTKKGSKPQFHKLQVPVTSEFANQFKAREEAEKVEKEKLKQLTLNINDRIEQEELQEMMQNMFVTSKQSMSQNTNRERKQRYNHPKGAPDADLIFGSK